MGLIERLLGDIAERRLRKSYREDLQYAQDPLNDIKDLGIDYFWCRCEELLPDDWSMGLMAHPDQSRPGRLLYVARAQLNDESVSTGYRTEPRTDPLRAIETLFYLLRDN